VWAVVGLGNPGARYEGTRHNVGFRVVDRLARRLGVEVSRSVHRALVGETRCGGERVLLVKPQAFMNASGESVGSIQRFYRLAVGQVVVAYDDVDLAVGRVRIRMQGGAGGHRGIASLIAALEDSAFVRVRVGVGRPPVGRVSRDYVLDAPSGPEAETLALAEERGADAVELIVANGPAQAMNQINQREASHGGPPL
jgi:peptidyl-tRNA hydrolase, PTH1 family